MTKTLKEQCFKLPISSLASLINLCFHFRVQIFPCGLISDCIPEQVWKDGTDSRVQHRTYGARDRLLTG